MATKNSTKDTTETRSDPIEVGPDRAQALAAAFDGIYHIFKGRVTGWDTTPEGDLVAHGFSVDSKYNPDDVLNAVASHVRRAPLMPTLAWINGKEPNHFESPQAVTTFTVQYFKGADGSGDSKVPEWVRTAAQNYKDTREGFYSKRGPKIKGISFKDLGQANTNFTPEALLRSDVGIEGLQRLMEIASAALETKKAQANAGVEVTPESETTVSAGA